MTCGAAAAVRGVMAPLSELLYIYSHSHSRYLFVETAAVLTRLLDGGLDTTNVDFAVVLFGDAPSDCGLKVHTFEKIIATGASPTAEETTPRAKRTDVATVLYTSGTTGHPKGVVLTHDNILSQLADISLGNLDPNVGEVFLSILPCWHVFERTAAYWCLSKGMNLVYSSKRHFRKDLAIHQPHMLISVPRVFENLHDAIVTKLEAASSVRKAIFAFFMFISLAFVKARRRLLRLQIVRDNRLPVFGTFLDLIELCMLVPLYALANLLVWKKIRQGVGGRLRICLSGGGSIAGYLEDFFECAGIDICVGYGLTETSPVIANRFGKHNVRGSTGMPLPRAYVKIVDRDTHEIVEGGRQGVLYVKGPYVFSKYLDNPEATAKAFDADGYFNTGDLAYTAPSGVVVISGRSKHLIVLSNGENIEPGPIEDALLGSSLVDQVMLVGQDERALGALVVPKLDVLESNGIIEKEFKENVEALLCEPFENRKELRKLEAELTKSQPFSGALNEELSRLNMERSNYSHMDRIAHVRVILIPFTLENRMMTQTLKIKKNVVEELFAPEIKDMYNR